MDLLQGLGLILVGIFFGALIRDHQRRSVERTAMSPRMGGQYTPRDLLCDRRRALLLRLSQAFPEYQVLCLVPAGQLLSLHGGKSLPLRREALRRQVQDFVIVDHQGVPRYVFNVGGERHTYSVRTQNREQAFVVWAMKKAGIPTFRISSLDTGVSPAQLRSSVGLYSIGLQSDTSTDTPTRRKPADSQESDAVVKVLADPADATARASRKRATSAKPRASSIWPASGAS